MIVIHQSSIVIAFSVMPQYSRLRKEGQRRKIEHYLVNGRNNKYAAAAYNIAVMTESSTSKQEQ